MLSEKDHKDLNIPKENSAKNVTAIIKLISIQIIYLQIIWNFFRWNFIFGTGVDVWVGKE
jgi:hypothetical protein